MSMRPEWAQLPHAQFAFPGPLRDRLVSLILEGKKTATTGLLAEYELGHEPFPEVGALSLLVDSNEHAVAVLRCTAVAVVRLGDVSMQHVCDEGEGDTDVASWRAGHEQFWRSAEMQDELGDPAFDVNDDTLVVLERFIVERALVAEGGSAPGPA